MELVQKQHPNPNASQQESLRGASLSDLGSSEDYLIKIDARHTYD
jgi:hypothetical protein